jgi:hypothetical protein
MFADSNTPIRKSRSYSVYENVQKHPSVFENKPPSFWRDLNNQKKFMNWAAEQLNIKEPSDWYATTKKVRKFCRKFHNA